MSILAEYCVNRRRKWISCKFSAIWYLWRQRIASSHRTSSFCDSAHLNHDLRVKAEVKIKDIKANFFRHTSPCGPNHQTRECWSNKFRLISCFHLGISRTFKIHTEKLIKNTILGLSVWKCLALQKCWPASHSNEQIPKISSAFWIKFPKPSSWCGFY